MARTQSVVFDVWAPGTHPGTHTSTLTFKNPNALYFFLEALARGHSMFFGQPFEVVALQNGNQVGTGVYTVRYAKTDDPAQMGVVELSIKHEDGLLRNFMLVAWHHMHDATQSRKRNATIDDIFGHQ